MNNYYLDAEEVMEYETHAGNNEFLNNDHYDDDEEEDDEDFLEMVELKPTTTTTTPQEFQEENSSSEELFRLRQEEESENFGVSDKMHNFMILCMCLSSRDAKSHETWITFTCVFKTRMIIESRVTLQYILSFRMPTHMHRII